MIDNFSSTKPVRSLTSAELGRLGEARFASLCAETGIFAQRPVEDQNGWDFLVELPRYMKDEEDGIPQPLHVFVQVKTVWSKTKDVDLRLSSAARLAKIPHPSFLCILEFSNNVELVDLHVIHIWGTLFERILRKLREMRAQGRSRYINKVVFSVKIPNIKTGSQPSGNDIFQAISNAVGENPQEYRLNKDKFLREAGFPAHSLKGSITVEASSTKEYQEFILGMKELPVKNYEATETRWDIKIPHQFPSPLSSVRLNVVPKEVEVTWGSQSSFKKIRLRMMAKLAPGIRPNGQGSYWVFDHPNIDMTLFDELYSIILKYPPFFRCSLDTFEAIVALMKIFRDPEPVKIQVFWQGRLLMEGLNNDIIISHDSAYIDQLDAILRNVKKITEAVALREIMIPEGCWQVWQEHLDGLCMIIDNVESLDVTFYVRLTDNILDDFEEYEIVFILGIEFEDFFVAGYSTCRGRFVPKQSSAGGEFVLRDFELREIRPVEKSNESMTSFVEEAKRITGLDRILSRWVMAKEGFSD